MTRRAALLLACLAIPFASPVLASAGTVGSGNVADIEPPVPHPDEAPCAVTLFSGASFGAATVPFTYAPPAGCPGPWAKVVLATDVAVTAGRQFDRTATIFIGGVNVLFGTTAEPRAALAPLLARRARRHRRHRAAGGVTAGQRADRQLPEQRLHQHHHRQLHAAVLPGHREVPGAAHPRPGDPARRRSRGRHRRPERRHPDPEPHRHPAHQRRKGQARRAAAEPGQRRVLVHLRPRRPRRGARHLRRRRLPRGPGQRRRRPRPASLRSTPGSTPAASTPTCGSRSRACRRWRSGRTRSS